VAVGVIGGVGVAVHGGMVLHQLMLMLSTRQPSPEPLVSLAIRQRNLAPVVTRKGRFTTVVMKPFELPLQAARPAIGLPRSVAIDRL
jgi:hypothetical protein